MEIFFRNSASGPQKKPDEHIINTETVVQIVEHRGPKSDALNIFPDLFSMRGRLNQKSLFENELNHELEVMGEHLNEQPKKDVPVSVLLPKLFDKLFYRNIKSNEHNMKEPQIIDFEKNEMKMFDKAFDDQFPFNRIFNLNNKNSDEFKLSSTLVKDEKSESKDSKFIISDNGKSSPIKESSKISDGTSTTEIVQLQQLDLLDCISRKSGLPRWLIASTVFTSALVVFWLCFSLSTPIEDNKMVKPKVRMGYKSNNL